MIHRSLLLNSQDRSTGTLNHPVWYLKTPMKCNRLKVESAIIPLTFQAINDNNCRFNLIEQSTPSTLRLITLAPGNYSSTSFCAMLSDAMTNAGTQTYTASLPPETGALEITAATNFQLSFANIRTQASYIMGYPLNAVTNFAKVVISPSVLEILGPDYIVLQTSGSISSDNRIAGHEDIPFLCTIPLDAPLGSICYYKDEASESWNDFGGVIEISTIDIQLLDNINFLPLDLEGKSFTIQLGLVMD